MPGQATWTTRFGFLMASVGFAVGLGNIWRFPYVTGENGGAAFVLIYLLCAFGIGVPIVVAEILIGRRGRAGSAGSLLAVAAEENRSHRWVWLGYVNQLTAFLIQVTYAVVCGWVFWYLFKALSAGFAGTDAQAAADAFSAVQNDAPGMLLWTAVALLAAGSIIYSGVQRGIERAVTVLMPTLFVLLLVLMLFNLFIGGFQEALVWLFAPDFGKIDGGVFLAALGQAFFSVGVGMAAMMTYGSYLPGEVRIVPAALIIVLADTLVALLAGLVIFPAVFHNGLDPAAGVGLIFQTLPVAFAQMPGGYLFAVLFFLLLSVAGVTSMVGLLEAIVAWLENMRGLSRQRAALLVVGANLLFSVISVLGYTLWSEWRLFGRDINATLDGVSNQILLPFGGLLIAVFAGWVMRRASARDELRPAGDAAFRWWWLLIRWPVPIAVAVILFVSVLGV